MEHLKKGRIVRKAQRDRIIVPSITYACEKWTWNEGQRSRIQTVEMNYLRGPCGLNMIAGELNESVHEKFNKSIKSEGMNCGVVEVVKRSTLTRWFDHVERMGRDELTKRIYTSGGDAVGVRTEYSNTCRREVRD